MTTRHQISLSLRCEANPLSATAPHICTREQCSGVDARVVGRTVSHTVMPACPHGRWDQRDGRAPAKLVHRSGERVFRLTSSKYQANRSQIAWSAIWEEHPKLVSFFHS